MALCCKCARAGCGQHRLVTNVVASNAKWLVKLEVAVPCSLALHSLLQLPRVGPYDEMERYLKGGLAQWAAEKPPNTINEFARARSGNARGFLCTVP